MALLAAAAEQEDVPLLSRLPAPSELGAVLPPAPTPSDCPPAFLKGVAISVWQNSCDSHSQWTAFAKRKRFWGQKGWKDAFLRANNFFVNYENDIKLAAGLGATSFRLSLEWARIEPLGPGRVDLDAIAKYHAILGCCAAHGLEPVLTLHHFTHPEWFEQRGGFAEEANLPLFVAFACLAFTHFRHRVKLWATFNEPTCFSFVGYIVGLWAPGQFMRFHKAGVVLCNMLKAHCAAYRALKQLPGGTQACIGLVHQHISFEPRHDFAYVRKTCEWMTFWFGTHVVLDFFKTGVFAWRTPFSSQVVMHVDEGIKAGHRVMDWHGINYYSRPALHWDFSMGASAANEPVSDTGFRLHPQGLYEAIVDASALGVPMYITETGIADAQDRLRSEFITSHYNMVLKALADGYDVRGIFYWTLMDNLEWHAGFLVKFGLYEWCPTFASKHAGTNSRPEHGLRLRKGAETLREMHKAWPDNLPALRTYAAGMCGKPALPPPATATATPAHGRVATAVATVTSVQQREAAKEARG